MAAEAAESEVEPLPRNHQGADHGAGHPQPGPALSTRLDDGLRELEHVDRLTVVDEIRLTGRRTAGHQVLSGHDETVNQIVHVGVIELGALAPDQDFHVTGDHTFEQLAEHGLVAAAPDTARADRTGQHPGPPFGDAFWDSTNRSATTLVSVYRSLNRSV